MGRKFEVIQPGNTASPPSSMRMPMRRKASRWQPGATPKTKDVVQAPPITPPPIVTCPGHPASPCPASTGKGPHTALPRPTRYAPYYSVRPTIMLIHRHQGRLFLDRKGGKTTPEGRRIHARPRGIPQDRIHLHWGVHLSGKK